MTGFTDNICRLQKTYFTLGSRRYDTGPSSSTTKISLFKVAPGIILPVVFVAMDLYSDGGMFYTMWNYCKETGRGDQYHRSRDTPITMANYVTAKEPTDSTNQDNNTNDTTAGGRDTSGMMQVAFLMYTSLLILLFSTFCLLRSNPLPSLLRGVHTAVSMGSREEEERDVPLPLGESYC